MLGNAIELARDVGMARGGLPVSTMLETLATSYVLSCVDPPNFTEGPPLRIRQHVFIEGPPGFAKTFSVHDLLLKRLCGATSIYEDKARRRHGAPQFLEIDAQTWARVRGSFTTKGALVYPLLKEGQHITFFGDFPQWLEQEDASSKIVSLGKAMEDRRIIVDLIKGSELDDKAVATLAAELEPLREQGFHYSERMKGYYYDVDQTFWYCSVFVDTLEKRISRKLDTSGFMSRTDHRIIDMNHDEEREYLRRPFRAGDPEKEDRLKSLFDMMYRTPFEKVPYPPDSLLLPTSDWFWDHMDRIYEATQEPLHSFSSARDTARVARLMLANAICRVFAKREVGDIRPVKTITYALEDSMFAKKYLTPYINHLENKVFDQSDGNHREEKSVASDALARYVKANPDGGETVQRRDFEEFVAKQLKKSKKTGERYIRDLRDASLITTGRHGTGVFYVGKDFLNRHGVFTIDQRHGLDEPDWEAPA